VPFVSTNLTTTINDPNVTGVFVSGTSNLPFQAATVGRLGRYVRVQLAGTNYLSLAEVQVVDAPDPIPGPDAIAAQTSWTPTGVVTASTAFAMIEVAGTLRTYQRGASGLLQES